MWQRFLTSTLTIWSRQDRATWICSVFTEISPERRWSIRLPLQMPCYDFTWSRPCLSPRRRRALSTFVVWRAVSTRPERIPRAVADAFTGESTSCRRISACNPNWDWFFEISSISRFRYPLYQPLYHVCSPRCKSHADLTSSPPSSYLRRQSSVCI